MLKPIFFKEYLKIKRPWLALLLLNVLLMGYIYIDTRQIFTMDHPEMVWYRVLHLGQINFTWLRYTPAFVGILIACIQYLPEMRDERLRLSLHLPVSPHQLILAHLLVGLIAGGVLIGLDLILLCVITALYFPMEGVAVSFMTALPWGLAGVAAYLGGALALLEPGIKLQIFNVAISAGVTGLFLSPAEPGGYARILFLLMMPIFLMIPSVLLPAYHFRFRRVSE